MSWKVRLKYALLAGLVGWIGGWLASAPFELEVARRYVDGQTHGMPEAVSKGFVVWAAFCLFMSVVAFVPVVLPLLLVTPPTWILRWRWLLIPFGPLAAMLAIDLRMGLLDPYYLHHREHIRSFFFTSINFFVLGFGLAVISAYVVLVKRRLSVDLER